MTLEEYINGIICFTLGNPTDNVCISKVPTIDKQIINEDQYFANMPERAWNFFLRGNQHAQKWLKDRKDSKLHLDDIRHCQKIIVAILETDRLMKEIDLVMTQLINNELRTS